MLDRSLAILGMDAVDPVLVGLVGRLGRQAVNEQIFGGAAVLDAVAEIDFETADARRCAGSAPVPPRAPAARDGRCRARARSPPDVAASVRRRQFQARRSNVSEGVMRAGNLCRHFHTGSGGFASFICSLLVTGSYRPCGTRRPARLPRNRTSDPAWSGPDRSGRPADDRCRGSR